MRASDETGESSQATPDVQEGSAPTTMLDLGPTDPKVVGPYRLIGRLGAGGMGVAYLGEGSAGRVVVKVLGQGAPLSEEDVQRWERELDAMRAAASERTVQLLDHDFSGRPPWFAMEFVPGHTLQFEVESRGPLPTDQVLPFASGLVAALQDIHSAGVVHRDLKPSNIMLEPPASRPRIIDFGVAALQDATMLTRTGNIVGTVGWLAPEQISHDEYSQATDVHAWGLCVLYAVAGENPYASSAPGAALYRVLHEPPDIPDRMPRALGRVVYAALAKDPSQRPELAVVAQRLRSITEGDDTVTGPDPWQVQATAVTRGSSRGLRIAAVVAVVCGLAAGVGVGLALISG